LSTPCEGLNFDFRLKLELPHKQLPISQLFYNIIIQLYYIAIKIAAIWHPKARLWIAGRKDWQRQLNNTYQAAPNSAIWVHCASLGEFEQGRPLMEKIKQEQPQQIIVLTFFSPSGYEIRKNYTGVDYVFYLPLDTATNATTFLEIIQPQLAIFIKYEFWFHFLSTLQKRAIPTYLVGAIFRPNQYFFKWYGSSYLSILQGFTHIFVQDRTSNELLREHGCKQVSIAGDPRIDRVVQIAATAERFPIIQAFKQEKRLLVIGSSHPKDLNLWQPFFKKNTYWKVLIVPHEVHPKAIQKVQQQLPYPSLCYTDVDKEQKDLDVPFLIIDTIGMLNQLYQYADVVYIGGGFGNGIHNTLEPAIFGVPILVGPNYEKFEEAKRMQSLGGLQVIHTPTNIDEYMRKLVSDTFRRKRGKSNRKYIESHAGGTEKIYLLLKNLHI